MNKLCCINTNEILDNSNFQNTIGFSTFAREDSNNFIPGSTSDLKSLPISDINIPTNKKIKIKSLSRLPISTKNLIRKNEGNPFENYKLLKKLGQGTFGQVYKIIHKKTGIIRAMKVIPKNNLKPGFTDKDIIHEITIMKNLDHPHVIKLFEFYIDEYNYYLINEFCTEGDLSEKILKLKSFPETIVKIIMAQIFNAVLYLNNKGIIHGDLKLENILVDSFLDNGNNRKEPKEKEKTNFIASIIQDAKNIKQYLSNKKIRRSSTNIYNNKIEENYKEEEDENKNKNNINKKELRNTLNHELLPKAEIKSDRNVNLFPFEEKNIIYECEEKKDEEINIKEERKDNYEDFNINDLKEDNIKYIDSSFDSDFESNNKVNSRDRISENNGSLKNITPNINILESNDNIKIKRMNLYKSTPFNINEENKDDTDLGLVKYKSEVKTIKSKKALSYNKLKIKNFELKLIDFGCSKIFTQYKRTFADTIGTLVYCSPEVLKNNYNQKCDIWSCGVIMYILLCGKYPFYGSSEEEITKKILTGNFDFNDKHFQDVSENAKDLIKKCLIHDKNKRITVKEAIRHEFFASEIDINNIFEDEIDTKIVLNNLKNNSKKISKFYQTVLAYLSYNFADKEELKKLRNIFFKIDLNLDGKLSKEELFIAYREAGINISKEELEKIIKSIDFDGNGYIEYEEFIRVTLNKEQLFSDVNLKTAFDMFDEDKNGTISLNEILKVIVADKDIDKTVIDQLKAEILKDGDENINFKHFKDIMLGLKNDNISI